MSRHIDADKLIEFANNTKDKTMDANDIARFPIADVRENVRGEWIQDEIAEALGVYLCSNCNIPTQIVDKSGNTHLSPFCPNCGADMRGDNNE